ncbi:MAG: hypothetical protein AAF680_10240, partial [Pseudomonadota bacterium]
VEVVVKPDPRLTDEQQEVIAVDYGMSERVLRINTRGILVNYLLQLLQLDNQTEQANPLAQQIVLANRAELSEWLYP